MLSKLSVKKPYTVIVGIILVLVLGYISFQHMTTDLLPSMNLPYVVVYTTYPGATPEQVEGEVTRPMEAAFATLTDVKKITSQSRDNASVVIMQFNDGANMDTALIEISSQLDQLKGTWDEDVGSPVALKLNPDMLPVAILSVTRDDMDILALSDYVTEELVPAFESLNGVASANASGVIEQEIDITIEQSRIDVVNSAVLREIDEELADVERQLNEGQAQISDGRRQLAAARSTAYSRIDQAEQAIERGESQIGPAIEELTQQRDALLAQRDALAANIASMEALVTMSDEERAALQQTVTQYEQLKLLKTSLEEQLAALQGEDADALTAQRAEAQARRDALSAERESQQNYIEGLEQNSAEALQGKINQLQDANAADMSAREAARGALTDLEAQKEQLEDQIRALQARVAALSGEATPAPTGSEVPEGSPSPTGSEAPGDSPSPSPTETGDSEGSPSPSPTDSENPGDSASPSPTDSENPGDSASPAPTDSENPGDSASPAPTGAGQTGSADSTPTAGPTATESAPAPAPSDDSGSATQVAPGGETAFPAAGQTDAPASSGDSSDTPAQADASAASDESAGSEAQSAPSDSASGVQPAADAGQSSGGDRASAPADQSSGGENAPAAYGQSSGSGAAEAQSAPSVDDRAAESAASNEAKEPSEALATLRGLAAAQAEEDDLDALTAQLSQAQTQLEAAEAAIAERTAEIEALNGDIESRNRQLSGLQRALETLEDESADAAQRLAEAQARLTQLNADIAALDEQLAAIDSQLATSQSVTANLAQQLQIVNQQIAQMEAAGIGQAAAMLSDPAALEAQYAQAQAGLVEMNAGIDQMNQTLEKLNQGIIPGGFIEGMDEDTRLSDARSQLASARSQMASAFAQAQSMLDEAAAEIAKARKEFDEKRDEAYENAGLDGVITVQMVSSVIGAQNFSMPAGYVKNGEQDQVLVRVGDKFSDLSAIGRMKLFSLGLESIDEVRLSDVASVKLVDNRDDVFTKLDGQDGILLSMEKQSTYSTADVADTILEKAAALQAADPSLHIVDLMNQGEYIDIVVDSVLNNLLTGGGLAILILLVFLLDWRPTLTVAFSIPISVVIAFVCMYFSGITLNVLSLSGLALGIGMLVDNSIVSIENVYRMHGEEGVPLLRACVEGVKSVSGALFSSTLTTICVFLPIVFVQGMARDLFADMGLTIAYSLLASLFVAMTVVPMMTSFLMRRSKPRKARIFSKIQAAYTAMLRGALRVKPLVLLAALALLAFSAMQVSKMGISFMPEVNSRQMSASLTPDSEMPQKEQQAQAAAIMTEMMEIEGIQSIGLMDGSGSMLSAGGSGYSYYIIVDDAAGRKNTAIASDIVAIGEKYGAELTAQASTMDISMMTGSGISVEITGDDIDVLQSIARDVAEIARNTEGTTDVSDGLEDAVPELRIVVNKELAIDENLTVGQVYQFVAQKLMEKVNIGKLTLDGKELDIELIEGRNLDITPEEIQNLEIEVETEDEDKRVRIGDIAQILDAESLATIHRSSQKRMVSPSFAIAEGYSANLVSDDFEARLQEYDVPAGYRVELTGENETVMSIMEDLVWMILVAVLLIFLIMVAQFQSFKSPIIVMFTIPLAFTGGLLALLLTHMDLSIVAMLGFLVLSGVVVNNGIVFIDCVNQLRIGGMEKREALIEAGRQRLRPILMTALTTILGMSTMALGQGTGAEMMQPMAVVSIGGLTYATLMTLFVVPVMYDLFNGKKMRAREIQMIREAAGLNGDEMIYGGEAAKAAAEAVPASPIRTDPAPVPAAASRIAAEPAPASAATSRFSADPEPVAESIGAVEAVKAAGTGTAASASDRARISNGETAGASATEPPADLSIPEGDMAKAVPAPAPYAARHAATDRANRPIHVRLDGGKHRKK